jgi:hypothetical protein
LFSVRNPEGRIDAGDANYVEIIHTNGPTLLIAGAGIGAPIGHADFWPNGKTSNISRLKISISFFFLSGRWHKSIRMYNKHLFSSPRC